MSEVPGMGGHEEIGKLFKSVNEMCEGYSKEIKSDATLAKYSL